MPVFYQRQSDGSKFSEYEMSVLGHSIQDEGFTEVFLPSFADVNAERERRLIAGASFTVAGITDPIPLQGRLKDQTVYLGLLAKSEKYKAAGVTDAVLKLRDAADTIHMLTPAQIDSLISQAITWFEDVMDVSWAMKDGTGDFTDGIPDNFDNNTHWP